MPSPPSSVSPAKVFGTYALAGGVGMLVFTMLGERPVALSDILWVLRWSAVSALSAGVIAVVLTFGVKYGKGGRIFGTYLVNASIWGLASAACVSLEIFGKVELVWMLLGAICGPMGGLVALVGYLPVALKLERLFLCPYSRPATRRSVAP
ncbi:MAG: hypothetical protein IAE99_02675 [Rhodothermales bacterium]|nr:hypothetical protein [Rhodothermales bacterium]